MGKDVYDNREIIVLGAGLVGSVLAIALSQRGYEVTIFEKRQDPRNTFGEEGRSINLALSDRGLRTLGSAGIQNQVLSEAIAMRGRMIHEANGSMYFYPYGEEGKVIYSISRIHLNKILLEEAERNGTVIFFENRCKKVLLGKKMIELEAGPDKELSQFHYNFLFGADGAFSRLRKEMMGHSGFNYSQEYISYGYKELSIPDFNGVHQLEPGALHIWPRGEFMLIALPNQDGSFTCTLFLPFEGEDSFASITSAEQLHYFFRKYFADVIQLMPDLETDFFARQASYMVNIQCHPWVFKSETALIGDAAHAILPFYGQGMNAGFEDVSILCGLLDEGLKLEDALVVYNTTRKTDTDAIGHLALHNFIEMRDLVSDPDFILRKEIEQEMHKKYPFYASLYSLVTFSNIPYSSALETGKQQDKMFEEILALENISTCWRSESGWKQIEMIFNKYNLVPSV